MYQPEFEECWATGLVSQHDPISHIMEITLDKVTFLFCLKKKTFGGCGVNLFHSTTKLFFFLGLGRRKSDG